MLRVKRVTQPCPGCNGANAIYLFDANGNVSSSTDFNGNKTTYTFDLARNLEISRTEAAGTTLARTTTTQWHPAFRLPTKITTPSGANGVDEVTDLAYDAQGNLVQKTITSGTAKRQWTTTYNARGQVLTVDGPRTDVADVTTYTYYGTADPCVACRGNVQDDCQCAWAGHDVRRLRRRRPAVAGHRPQRGDDDVRLRRAGSVAGAHGQRGHFRRGDRRRSTTTMPGQLTKVTMPDGAFLRYQYDDAHRLTEVADSQDNVIQYTLDAMGNRIKEDVFDPADRLVRTRQRIYDALNRLYNDIGAAGQISAYRYDGNGNLATSVDPLARTTMLGYDALNRLLTSTDPAGGVTRYAYDAKDRLVSVRDPINLTTTYSYDGLGNLTQLDEPRHGNFDVRSGCPGERGRCDRCARTCSDLHLRCAQSPDACDAMSEEASPWSTTTPRPAVHSPGAA